MGKEHPLKETEGAGLGQMREALQPGGGEQEVEVGLVGSWLRED